MKKRIFGIIFIALFVCLVGGVKAQEETVEPKVTGKFGAAVKQLREQNQETRKMLLEQNKSERENLRGENKASREAQKAENEEERELFKANTDARLQGLTDAEKKALLPTIQAERKALMETNKTERQTALSAAWDSKKSLNENIQAKMNSFRQTVRTSWTNLWSSFFGKK